MPASSSFRCSAQVVWARWNALWFACSRLARCGAASRSARSSRSWFSRASMTVNVYVDVVPATYRSSADAMDRALAN